MIVIDTSVLVAFNNRRDVFHSVAQAAMEGFAFGTWGKGLLLEYVFLETMNVLKRKLTPAMAIHAGGFLRRSHQLEFVSTSDLFPSFWNEFRSDYLSPLSFTDHALAHIARQRAGGKILTFDKAFQGVPGLTILPER